MTVIVMQNLKHTSQDLSIFTFSTLRMAESKSYFMMSSEQFPVIGGYCFGEGVVALMLVVTVVSGRSGDDDDDADVC